MLRHSFDRLIILVLLVGMALSAACGGQAQVTTETLVTDDPASSSTVLASSDGVTADVEDACTLLSTEELAAAVGGSWGEPRNVPGGQSVECDYVDDSTRSKFFVAIYTAEAVTAAGGPEAMIESLAFGAEGTELDIGDGAFFYTLPNIRDFVIMQIGGTVVQISGETTFGLDLNEANMAAIAQTIADKLG
ncbi:MAG TPA: hypothetical protein VIA81_13025 [Acidimicrobiia bacterium]